VDVLTAEECRAVRDDLHALRDRWQAVGAPFFILGAASYIDGRQRGGGVYREHVDTMRPLLAERFGWLYDRVGAALARHLNGPIRYPDSLGLPGFHIYVDNPALASFVPSAHVDLQFTHLEWSSFGAPDLANPLSFTLAISLPRAGGGLNVWPLRLDDCRGLTRPEVDARLAALPPVYHPYAPGAMAIHSGFQFHQIAPMVGMQPDDERITLQGHGVQCDGVWCLYW
jgi:hypothetical protein